MDIRELEEERYMKNRERIVKYGEPGLLELLSEFAAKAGTAIVVLKAVKVQPVAMWSWWKAAALFVAAIIVHGLASGHRKSKLNSQ